MRTLSPSSSAKVAGRTIPLALFGMPLGLAGLAGAWTATVALGAPVWPAEVLYAASSALWLILGALYFSGGLRRRGTFRADVTHPVGGPFVAVIPLIAVLLAAHYTKYDFTVFGWICGAAIAALAVVMARLIAHWLNGGVELASLHGGYFIPVVAGPNVASIGFSTLGMHDAAIASVGAGIFFWIAITAAMIVRMVSGADVPVALKPGTAGFLAATATTNLAWLLAHPTAVDTTQQMLTGVLVIMLLVQGFLITEYGKLRFGQSWWIFTFPLASTANYALHWLDLTRVAGWQFWSWLVLAVVTAFVLYVAARTVSRAVRPA
ncbi:TDT family transporter [Gryllotalpicola reticulitermitis]|uniref:TDT family transporter n=1 Tax=Gryllotalpicola reticulitermitis TaxID=1184153 RepID=A0ABV8Q868_9MICO